MSIFKRGFFILFAALWALTACRKEDAAEKKLVKKVVLSAITGVNGPVGGKVNQELQFNVMWQNADTALRFDHLFDSAARNTRIIKLYAKTLPEDSLKLDTLGKPIHYKFKAATAGTYFLKFYKDNSGKSAIIDTVVIK